MIIEGNPTISEQFVNAFIEEKHENQNKIPDQLSRCQYRNADENVNVQNARVTIVSRIQFRMRCEREPTRISDKMVSRLSYGKKKSIKIIHAEICPEMLRCVDTIVIIS